jgi:hypothetical protein
MKSRRCITETGAGLLERALGPRVVVTRIGSATNTSVSWDASGACAAAGAPDGPSETRAREAATAVRTIDIFATPEWGIGRKLRKRLLVPNRDIYVDRIGETTDDGDG